MNRLKRSEMKKSPKTRIVKASKAAKPDIAELITKMQQQMIILEMKVDVLIERLTVKPSVPEIKPQPAPIQHRQIPEPQRQNEVKPPAGNNAGRIMHKAVCADCAKECEVPFVPREGRAVYCKECFSKRKAGGQATAKVNGNAAPAAVKPVQAKPVPVQAAPAGPERKKWGNVKRKGAEKKTSRKPKNGKTR